VSDEPKEGDRVSTAESSAGAERGPLPGDVRPVDRIAAVDDALGRLAGATPAEQVPVYEELSRLLTATLADAGDGHRPARSGT
jgi:hypothetical protein